MVILEDIDRIWSDFCLGTEDCDAGHILANRLGGPGNQPINIFPQDLSVNRGSYAQFEGDIYECISGGASSASLSWTFTYESTSHTKPYKVSYSATFEGGPCTSLSQVFSNWNLCLNCSVPYTRSSNNFWMVEFLPNGCTFWWQLFNFIFHILVRLFGVLTRSFYW